MVMYPMCLVDDGGEDPLRGEGSRRWESDRLTQEVFARAIGRFGVARWCESRTRVYRLQAGPLRCVCECGRANSQRWVP